MPIPDMLSGLYGINRKNEAMLYYLYMMCDGEVSYSEEKVFNKICNDLKIEKKDVEEVITDCRVLAPDPESAFSVIVREKIEENVINQWFGISNKSERARIIWNLLNLGYADTRFSENEKKIVSYIVRKWNIDDNVYQEMVDTSETMLALVKQKEWLLKTFFKDKERDEKEKIIDNEIDKMFTDITITIEELKD